MTLTPAQLALDNWLSNVVHASGLDGGNLSITDASGVRHGPGRDWPVRSTVREVMEAQSRLMADLSRDPGALAKARAWMTANPPPATVA